MSGGNGFDRLLPEDPLTKDPGTAREVAARSNGEDDMTVRISPRPRPLTVDLGGLGRTIGVTVVKPEDLAAVLSGPIVSRQQVGRVQIETSLRILGVDIPAP
jgi:hypothetical protein